MVRTSWASRSIVTSSGDGLLRMRIGAPEDPAADGRPIDERQIGVDPEAGGATYRFRDLGGVHQHLRRDATAIQARPTEPIAFDDRDALTGRPLSGIMLPDPAPTTTTS